ATSQQEESISYRHVRLSVAIPLPRAVSAPLAALLLIRHRKSTKHAATDLADGRGAQHRVAIGRNSPAPAAAIAVARRYRMVRQIEGDLTCCVLRYRISEEKSMRTTGSRFMAVTVMMAMVLPAAVPAASPAQAPYSEWTVEKEIF